MPAAARLQPRGPRATDRATITLDRAVPSRPSRNALSEASTLRQRMCKCSQLCIGRERLARRSWHDVCVEGELLVLSCSSLLEMCFFMHLKKTFTQRHTRIMRTLCSSLASWPWISERSASAQHWSHAASHEHKPMSPTHSEGVERALEGARHGAVH